MVKDNFGNEITEGCEVYYINARWRGHQVMDKATVEYAKGDRVYLKDASKQWVINTKVAVITNG